MGALFHALQYGAQFPRPDKSLKVEEMDSLASRLAQDQEGFFPLALSASERADKQDWQQLCWARGMLMAAVRTYPWRNADQDEEQGMTLARAFAKIEERFLSFCYTPEALSESGLFALPPMHRFGWYCARAFAALEQGSTVEYVRLLRKGLDSCEGMKDMVEFLADNTPQLQTPSAELNALAEQIRDALSRFSPDDPAVAALKQSEAYQKVAHLIEGSELPIIGGFLQ